MKKVKRHECMYAYKVVLSWQITKRWGKEASLLVLSIDENLTWSNHINAITKKVSSGIGSIKRISHCRPLATLYNIYHGLAQSRFDYCSVVWGKCAKTLPDKLQRLQNRAVRVLIHTSYDADANQLLKELGLGQFRNSSSKTKGWDGL